MVNLKLKKDKTIFCDFLGYSPESKILEYMLEVRELDFTFNDIVLGIGVNRKRAYAILKSHLKNKVLIPSRQVKHIKFYKLNVKNPRIKILTKLFNLFLLEIVNKHSKKESKK